MLQDNYPTRSNIEDVSHREGFVKMDVVQNLTKLEMRGQKNPGITPINREIILKRLR